jgi:hypothetical protein
VLRTAGTPTSWKWLLVRGVVVLAVMAWAFRVMNAPVRTSELPRVGNAPAVPGLDAGAVTTALAEAKAYGCPVEPGTRLWVRVGPAGLERARVLPPVDDPSCLAAATWLRRWPSVQEAIEIEFPIGE